jgi:hypothetical protein
MFRVGLYARLSTHDQQTLSLQMRAMCEYAAKRGWTIAVQIREVGSGAAERELRASALSRIFPPCSAEMTQAKFSVNASARVLPKRDCRANTWVGH